MTWLKKLVTLILVSQGWWQLWVQIIGSFDWYDSQHEGQYALTWVLSLATAIPLVNWLTATKKADIEEQA